MINFNLLIGEKKWLLFLYTLEENTSIGNDGINYIFFFDNIFA